MEKWNNIINKLHISVSDIRQLFNKNYALDEAIITRLESIKETQS